MAKMDLTIQVEKETYEFAHLLAKVGVALLQKKPLAEIAMEELKDAETAADGFNLISGEYKDDPAAFMKAVVNPMSDIVGQALAPKPPAA